MKTSTFLAAAICSAALISSHLYGQDSRTGTDLSITRPGIANSPNGTAGPAANDAAASTINHRATTDFKRRFSKASDERWSRIDRGYYAYFTTDGYKVRAYYDLKGHWQASIRYCGESQLPHDIRDIVKRTYYDFGITYVNIVEVPDHTAYLIYLEDKDTLKIVRVNEDGEMDLVNNFAKAH